MTKKAFATLLVACFMLSALGTLGLAVRYVWLVRSVRQLQVQATQAQRDRNLVNALATEAFEYGKKNPAIAPILESAGIRLRSAGMVPSSNAPSR